MPPSDPQPRLIFLSGDLVFASRVRGACEEAGYDFHFGANLPPPADPQAAQAVPFVVLDLATRSGLTEKLVADARVHYPNARLIAYAPHVHKGKLQAASEAGFDEVLTRGQFDRWLTQPTRWKTS
ncbi:histidine kinase [Planctomycetaceae bacterium SH139]